MEQYIIIINIYIHSHPHAEMTLYIYHQYIFISTHMLRWNNYQASIYSSTLIKNITDIFITSTISIFIIIMSLNLSTKLPSSYILMKIFIVIKKNWLPGHCCQGHRATILLKIGLFHIVFKPFNRNMMMKIVIWRWKCVASLSPQFWLWWWQ